MNVNGSCFCPCCPHSLLSGADPAAKKEVYNVSFYRQQSMAILATIHAPPLSSSTITKDCNHHTLNVGNDHGICRVINQALVSLTEKHSQLIQQMEHTIQAIRTLSSVQLGLGPFSPSVDRIENKSIAQGLISLTGVQATMRRFLMRIILEQHASLRKVAHAFQCNEVDELPVVENSILNIFDEKSPCTLTVLDSCIKENKSLLSHVISMAFEATLFMAAAAEEKEEKENSSTDFDKQLSIILRNSMSLATEHKVYLESFAMRLDSFYDLDGSSSSFTLNERKNTVELEKFMYESQVLLWAFLHDSNSSSSSSSSSSRNEMSTDKDVVLREATHSAERIKLWQQFSMSLQKILDMHHILEQSMFPKEKRSDTRENENNGEVMERTETLYNESVHGLELKDEGKPLNHGMLQVSKSTQESLKTVVFSGKGLKSKQMRDYDSSPSFDMAGSDASILMRKESIGQSILMTELQTRLSRMQRPQEIEVRNGTDGGDHCHDASVLDKRITRSTDKIPTNTFTALKGNVISELANALLNND